MRRASRITTLAVAVALVALAAAPAFAQTATPQIKLNGALVPKFAQQLPLLYVPDLGQAGPGIPVALGATTSTNPLDPTYNPTFPGGLQEITLGICEFTSPILPPGTPLNAGADLQTAVWGYREDACPTKMDNGPNVPYTLSPLSDSYIGPVVVAQRHVPTRITYQNQLGDSSKTNVLAYKFSTDLTLMWADPLSLLDPRATGTDPNIPETYTPTNNLLGATLLNGQNTSPVAMPYSPMGGVDGGLVFAPEENMCNHTAVPGALPLGICASNYFGPIPAAPHLHGGEVPAVLDGGPDAWWTQDGIYGHGYYSLNGFAQVPLGAAIYTYPNTQEAAPIWFHDHVLGATRLNVYAGIAGAYMVTDPVGSTHPIHPALGQSKNLATGLLPLGLDTNGDGLTDPTPNTGELLVPLVLQDRAFDTDGELYFDSFGSGFGTTDTHPYWVPEFVGDTIAVNGKVWPNLNVAPKRYRFLFINGSNARAYALYLATAGTKSKIKKNGKPAVNQNSAGPAIYVIGNDQGYLDAPALVDPLAATNNKLIIMPGERYEVIIDFSLFAGQQLTMLNTAAIPFPFGGAVVPGLDDTIMQFSVNLPAPAAGACGAPDCGYDPALGGSIRIDPLTNLPAQSERLVLDGLQAGTVNPLLVANPADPVPTPGSVHKTRRLTLNEAMDPITLAPLELLMNNTKYTGEGNLTGAGGGPRTDFSSVTTRWNVSWYSELPVEGETEIWEIINFSADAHPIHPHLVAFQILNRQAFDAIGYTAAYDAAFVGTGGVYEPGVGPPLDYNCNLGVAAQGPGYLDPAVCVLGGNPDPTPFLLGAPVPALATESGWKDTAISYPGEILRILIRYAPPPVPVTTPSTDALAAYDFSPADGHGYVWHCHIIDHEDNEMMRPYNVMLNANAPAVRAFAQGTHY